MSELSLRDREMVALGAAIAANCIPCVEYHVPKAREAGISADELVAVFALADTVRQVPAAKVLAAASAALGETGVSDVPSGADQCTEMMAQTGEGDACC
jgi:4-carboxymuconolactone decarboxylase